MNQRAKYIDQRS